jgi:hypothetical protein
VVSSLGLADEPSVALLISSHESRIPAVLLGQLSTAVTTASLWINKPCSLTHYRLFRCKIWCFHGVDYEVWRLRGYKTPVRTSQKTHFISVTESSQLMLFKIWCFHGVDYEVWRLLGYKTPVRTSQETHFVSVTESSRLMLCKIWGFHGVD